MPLRQIVWGRIVLTPIINVDRNKKGQKNKTEKIAIFFRSVFAEKHGDLEETATCLLQMSQG
jgi:hypothetical protein